MYGVDISNNFFNRPYKKMNLWTQVTQLHLTLFTCAIISDKSYLKVLPSLFPNFMSLPLLFFFFLFGRQFVTLTFKKK